MPAPRHQALSLLVAACALAGVACGSSAPALDFPDSTPPREASADVPVAPPEASTPRDARDAGDATADAWLDAARDAADATADTSDAPFEAAAHALALINGNGGPVLAHPTIVTVTYANDPQRVAAEQTSSYLATSPWLSAVGAEYGVGLGINVNLELPGSAPTTIEDSAIQALVQSLVVSMMAPDPDGGVTATEVSGSLDGGTVDGGPDGWNGLGDSGPPVRMPDAIYMMFFPSTTAVTWNGVNMCSFSGGGYHGQTALQAGGQAFAYAVITECASGGVNFITAVSHELIEAATDPSLGDPAYYLTDPYSPWATVGGEVGDLCSFLAPQWSEGGFAGIQRVYSNASAKAGGDPCLPSSAPYYGTDVEPPSAQALAAGTSMVYGVNGWSTGPVGNWKLSTSIYTASPSGFQPTVSLSATSMNNGGVATLTVGVQSGAASGSYSLLLLYSYNTQADYTTTLVEVYVP